MRQPERALRILAGAFADSVCCTGAQLSRLLDVVANVAVDLVWYYADVETNDTRDGWRTERAPYLVAIGTSADAIQKVTEPTQFLSGVFVGAPTDVDLTNTEWWTDDEPFRALHGASVVIRAFDTSCFEVYALDGSLLETLADAVGGEMVSRSHSAGAET